MCFDILGIDVIIDDNFKPYILEVNHAPSFNLDTELDKKLKTDLINNVFDILNLNLKTRRKIIQAEKKRLKERIFR